jgi:hypothetical protein
MIQSTVVLRTVSLPTWSPRARRIEIDCLHATTGISILEGADTPHIDDGDAVRMALARHHAEEGCRCTAQLWREYFGAALGERVLVRGGDG